MTKPKHDKWPFTEPDRFEQYVDRSGDCHQWIGCTTQAGYGRFSYTGGKHVSAHRFAWEMAYEPIPTGKLVLHRCDNPGCVNPDHLYLGTHQDNMDDKVRRGRLVSSPGERNGMSKLTQNNVDTIRELYATGYYLQREIGVIFNVSNRQISRIIRRDRWAESE